MRYLLFVLFLLMQTSGSGQKATISGQKTLGLLSFTSDVNDFRPSIFLPSINLNYGLQRPNEEEELVKVSDVKIKVSPNPTNGLTEVSYEIAEKIKCQEIWISDFFGNKLMSEDISMQKGNFVFNSKKFPQGILLCQLICNGEVVHVERILSIQ